MPLHDVVDVDVILRFEKEGKKREKKGKKERKKKRGGKSEVKYLSFIGGVGYVNDNEKGRPCCKVDTKQCFQSYCGSRDSKVMREEK